MLQSMELHRVKNDWSSLACMHALLTLPKNLSAINTIIYLHVGALRKQLTSLSHPNPSEAYGFLFLSKPESFFLFLSNASMHRNSVRIVCTGNAVKGVNHSLKQKSEGIKLAEMMQPRCEECLYDNPPCLCCHLGLWTASSGLPGNNMKPGVSSSACTEGDLDYSLAEWGNQWLGGHQAG